MVLLSAQDVDVRAAGAGRRPRWHQMRRPGAAVRAGDGSRQELA